MNKFSLVFFTLLIQISVGIMCATFINILVNLVGIQTNHNGIVHIPFIILLTCLGLIIPGLISAMAHLGNPKKAPYALSNISCSWLSREIISVNMFAAGTGLLCVLTWFELLKGLFFIEIASLIFGIFAVWTMSQVYALRTIPVWNHISTSIDFFGTVLLSGGVSGSALDLFVSGNTSEPCITFLICSFSGFICKIFAIYLTISIQKRSKMQFWYASSRAKSTGRMTTYVVLVFFYFLGSALFAAAHLTWNHHPLFFLIPSLGIILMAEIWQRFRFYDSFCRLGL